MCGFASFAHAGELVHQLLVDVQAAGGVEDDRVAAVGLRARQAVTHRRDGIAPFLAVDRHLDLATELLELLDRRRALQVGGDERRLLAVLAQEQRELRRGRSSCPSPGGRRAG